MICRGFKKFCNNVLSIVERNTFGRDVATLLGGVASAQIIFLCVSPFLTRFYDVRQLGVLGLAFSLVAISGPIVCFSFPPAILQAETKRIAKCLARLSLLISGTICTAGLIVVCFAISTNLGKTSLTEQPLIVFGLIGTCVFLSSCNTVASSWNGRNRNFRAQSLSRAVGALLSSSIFVAGGIWTPTETVLLLGLVAGLAGSLTVHVCSGAKYIFMSDPSMGVGELKATFVCFKAFPGLTMPGAFLNRSVSDLPFLILTAQFGLESAGQFFLARRCLVSPVSVACESISQVFHQRIAHLKNHGQSGSRLVLKLAFWLGVSAAVPFLLVGIFAPKSFEWIFGSEWIKAGQFVQILLPFYFMKLVVSPISRVTLVYNKQGSGLIWQISFAALTSVALMAGGMVGADSASLIFYSGCGVMCYSVMLSLCIYWSR